ncbi:hypothetical protein [Desulfovulcanus sp.]
MVIKRKNEHIIMQIFRGLGLVAVFVAVGILFWKHYERSITTIQARQSIWDQTKTLTEKQKKSIYNFSAQLKKRYGLTLQLKITKERVFIPKLDSKTIFIGLCPKYKEVIVRFPPLVEKVLGIKFLRYLQEEHFVPYFENDNWPQGLGEALNLIAQKLMEVENG